MTTEDTTQHLSLLASAVAGRLITVDYKAAPAAFSNGQTLFIPNGASLNSDTYFTVIAQALMLADTSYNKTILKHLQLHPQAIERYLSIELQRLSKHYVDRIPRFFNTRCGEFSNHEQSHSAEESMRIALSRKRLQTIPAIGTIKPRALMKHASNKAATLALSQAEIEQLLNSDPVIKDDNKAQNQDDDDGNTANSKTKLSGMGDNAISDYLKNMLGNESTPDSDDSGGSMGQISTGTARFIEKLSAGAKVIAKVLLLSDEQDDEAHTEHNGLSYPEWDFKKQQYKPRWCRIHQYDPPLNDTDPEATRTTDKRLSRQLARLGLKYERYGRQLDGTDLDTSALVDLAVDKASGVSNDGRIYETHKKTGRDLGVIILLDASGSTEEENQQGDSIWDKQRTLTHNLMNALDGIGDSVAAYGFRSYGRSDVRFLRIKQFNKRLDESARKRLMALAPSGYTRLGAAIRHAAQIVKAEAGTTNQLLVLVSDGLPYDIEYSDAYAEQDVRHALQETVNSGIACVCLTAGASTDAEIIERVWGHVGHANVPVANKLSQDIVPLFKAALQQASKRPVNRVDAGW